MTSHVSPYGAGLLCVAALATFGLITSANPASAAPHRIVVGGGHHPAFPRGGFPHAPRPFAPRFGHPPAFARPHFATHFGRPPRFPGAFRGRRDFRFAHAGFGGRHEHFGRHDGHGWHGPRYVFEGGRTVIVDRPYPVYAGYSGYRGWPSSTSYGSGDCSVSRHVSLTSSGWHKVVTIRVCYVP